MAKMSMRGDRERCALCDRQGQAHELVHGARGAICRSCVNEGITSTLHGTANVRDGESTPRSFVQCRICGLPTAPPAIYEPSAAHSACVRCLTEAYALLTQAQELATRRRLSFGDNEDRYAAVMLSRHFEGLSENELTTTSRTFPVYLRVDLQRVLERLLAGKARNVGLHARHNYETVTYASLIDARRDPVLVAPLSYEDVDIGEEQPARCLRSGLWFAEESQLRFVVLLTEAHQHGRGKGWHLEICVPAGSAGEKLVRKFFSTIESATEASTSYRGKVLSLEREPHYDGATAGMLLVHRLSMVDRDSIILPEKTLQLLERNVFQFVAHRKRLKNAGMGAKKGLLFYGPPGTGKTHTIRYLSRIPAHTTLLITAEQVTLIAEYMALARLLSPAVVVIEDVDLIARDRADLQSAAQESLLNRLLNEMDGLRENSEIIFILTTNRPEALEPALAGRPGRIDQAIEFPLPDDAGRARLLELYRYGLTLPKALSAKLVKRTEGVSAAFIKELMRRSAQFAFERRAKATSLIEADTENALRELLFEGGSLNATLLGAHAARV